MFIRLQNTFAVLSPDALRLCIATFLSTLPIGYLSIVLPIYLNKIGINPRDIGGLYAVSSIVSALLIFIFGLMADRFGRKPFVLLGLLLPVVAYVIFLTTTDLFMLTLAAGIGGVGLAQGLSGALAGAGFNALLAEKSTGKTGGKSAGGQNPAGRCIGTADFLVNLQDFDRPGFRTAQVLRHHQPEEVRIR